jgi:hypothetical protein
MTNLHPYVAMAEISWRQERIRGDLTRSTRGREEGARRFRARRSRRGSDIA